MTDRRLPTSRLARVVKPALTSSRAALTFGRGKDLDRVIRSAQQVTDLMGEMKGAFMKMGQLISFADPGFLPLEAREVLATLQADAPPMAYELVAQVVEEELGRPPDKAFDWFSPAPMASASIGLVHAARLGDQDVVVKVQYPGVADAVAADLNNAGLMAAFVRLVQPMARQYLGRSDIQSFVDEVRDRVLEELDYVSEAANQRLFADLYRGHPLIRVPEIVDDRSTGRVLTSEYHDGMRWAAAVEQPQELKDRWAEAIYRFVFGSVYEHGVVNADPHPGNYLFHEDGGVTFLDFGSIKRIDPATLAGLVDMGLAVLDDDAEAMTAAMGRAGFFRPGTVDAERFYAAVRPSYLPLLGRQPFTFDPAAIKEMLESQMGMADEYRTLTRHLSLPADYVFLGRAAIGCHAILAGLNATGGWRAIMQEIWQVGNTPDTAAS